MDCDMLIVLIIVQPNSKFVYYVSTCILFSLSLFCLPSLVVEFYVVEFNSASGRYFRVTPYIHCMYTIAIKFALLVASSSKPVMVILTKPNALTVRYRS